MSTPRVLLVPTHRSGLAAAVAAAIAEVVGKQRRQVRYHHLGVSSPSVAWDRWEGSSFLDPSLYDADTLLELYELSTRGADLSLLASEQGLLDPRGEAAWTPESVARLLDCPIVLLCDARGWGRGLAAVVAGFNERLADLKLAAVIVTGVEDRKHKDVLRRAAAEAGVPMVGCLYSGGELPWDEAPPGAAGLPLAEEVLSTVSTEIDLPALESIAAQRAFLPGAVGRPREGRDQGPLVLVAAGRGFTPWSRDSIEVLGAAGARVRRLDLAGDEALPDEVGGLVIAGHLWLETLGELAANFPLMRHIRVRIADGLPALALGGGMLYLLRGLQDPLGRSHQLAGVLPMDGELLGEMEEPLYLRVKAERDCLLLSQGEEITGWMPADAEIVEASVTRSFPLSVRGPDWPEPRFEGAALGQLLCSRVLLHLASLPGMATRFVAACNQYSAS